MERRSTVVDMDGREHAPSPPDFWVAQVDLRLNQIETALSRLEWQIWLVLCAVAGLVVLRMLTLITAV